MCEFMDRIGNDLADAYADGYGAGYEDGKRDAVKHGKWEYKFMEGQYCSECGRFCMWKFDFCPNCGAHMDLSENPTGCDGANMGEEVSTEVSEEVEKGEG